MSNLIGYRHALRQRNALLQSGARSSGFAPQLDAWTREVVKYGSRLIYRRYNDIAIINGYLDEAFTILDISDELPTMHYRCGVTGLNDRLKESSPELVEIEDAYFSQLVDSRDNDIARRRTMSGPHRDELDLYVNERPLRNYASQGQHRTFAMALKFAQYHYLRSLTGEKPIVLLDDAFDHLDPVRVSRYIDLVGDNLKCQTFITTANPSILDHLIDYSSGNKRVVLEPAKVGKDDKPIID